MMAIWTARSSCSTEIEATDDNYVAALVMIADLYQADGVWEAALEEITGSDKV